MIQQPYAPEFGPAAEPEGFAAFNLATREENPRRTLTPVEIQVEPGVWEVIRSINRSVNGRIHYRRSPEIVWTYPKSVTGDCRSITLQKRKELVAAGIPRAALSITIVLDREGQGHVVLMARTNRGDMILDNQVDTIASWEKSGLYMVQRQSFARPINWVALNPAVVRA